MKDRFQELGKELRAFLKDFRDGKFPPSEREKILEHASRILGIAEEIQDPHLGKEVRDFVQAVEAFSHDKAQAKRIEQIALRLETETREL